jgi:hypothetical protein
MTVADESGSQEPVMRKQTLASFVLKLMAVYVLAVHGPILLINLISSVSRLSNGHDVLTLLTTALLGVIVPIGYVILCIAIIRESDSAAAMLFHEDDSLKASIVFSFREVQALVFSAIGLLVLATGIPKLINTAGVLTFQLSMSRQSYPGSHLTSLPQLIGVFAQIGIGLWLVFRPQGMVNLWYIVQEYGREKRAV